MFPNGDMVLPTKDYTVFLGTQAHVSVEQGHITVTTYKCHPQQRLWLQKSGFRVTCHSGTGPISLLLKGKKKPVLPVVTETTGFR